MATETGANRLLSGGGSYTEVVSSAQVRWFHTQSQFLNPDGGIPELIFWHIPSTAYTKVAPKANSEIRKPCVSSINGFHFVLLSRISKETSLLSM
jgi:hypothetical protein